MLSKISKYLDDLLVLLGVVVLFTGVYLQWGLPLVFVGFGIILIYIGAMYPSDRSG